MSESAPPLSDAAQRVQDALRARGFAHSVVELAIPVRTARDAADAVGCDVAQIVKSLVLRGETTGRGVLVETCGVNRVDLAKVAAACGEPVAMANPKFRAARKSLPAERGGNPFRPSQVALLLREFLERFAEEERGIEAAHRSERVRHDGARPLAFSL